jgi:hypothetical protein
VIIPPEYMKAYSRYFTPALIYEWRPCRVLEYNEIERTYLIEWEKQKEDDDREEILKRATTSSAAAVSLGPKTKYVRRLNLFFEVEMNQYLFFLFFFFFFFFVFKLFFFFLLLLFFLFFYIFL